MSRRSVQIAEGPLTARLRAAPSKSVTHRALVAAALATGRSRIVNPLVADDTRVTLHGLAALGIDTRENGSVWEVFGRGGRVPGGGTVELRDSGTSCRLLAAVAAIGDRRSTLDGSARLRERPVGELTDALVGMGARVEPAPDGGGLPLSAGGAVVRGGAVAIPAGRSSQFASALLMIGSRLPGGLDLTLEPPAVSLPYVEITERVLRDFGVAVERRGPLRWTVEVGDHAGREFVVEGDHSSASYFLAAAVIVGGRVRMDGLRPDSAQPDARLGRLIEELGGRLRRGEDWIEAEGDGRIPGFDVEMTDAPDLVPTLAALALFSDGPCTIRGVAHLRLKESDRLDVLAGNLRRLGREATAEADALVIAAPNPAGLEGGCVETASDHRIAMAFAVAGLRLPGVSVDDADCVAKSNPDFWSGLEAVTGRKSGPGSTS